MSTMIQYLYSYILKYQNELKKKINMVYVFHSNTITRSPIFLVEYKSTF